MNSFQVILFINVSYRHLTLELKTLWLKETLSQSTVDLASWLCSSLQANSLRLQVQVALSSRELSMVLCIVGKLPGTGRCNSKFLSHPAASNYSLLPT